MSIAFISHPDCLLHEMGANHPECPSRLEVIESAVKNSSLWTDLKTYQAPKISKEQLLRVHDEAYVNSIFAASPSKGHVILDLDVTMNPHSLDAALRAAGAAVYAVELVMAKEQNAAFCNIRPPGHHAEHNKAMGFCIFNNVAVAAAHALQHFNLKRVAIVDFDVHHGNGTEDIFSSRQSVLYCSSFEHPFYPFSGSRTRSDHIINIPLPRGSTGELLREKAEALWFDKLKNFKPQLIFFSAGFDAYYQDTMADLLLKEEDYLWITQRVADIAADVCEGKMVSVLEGGYDLSALGSCVVAHIQGLMHSLGDKKGRS